MTTKSFIGASTQVEMVEIISLFNHVLRDLGGARDRSHFLQGWMDGL